MCEDFSETIGLGSKQSEYDAEIEESEYFYVMFYRKAGAYTIGEFDTALKKFRESGTPKIMTFFKEVEGDVPTEVLAFMERLDRELQHYYTRFKSIDTVKLKILLELCQHPELQMNVEIKDAKILLNGTQVDEINIDNLPFYGNHEAIGAIREELSVLEREFAEAKKASALAPDDDSLWTKCYEVSKRKNEALDKLHEYELQLMELSANIVKISSRGEYVTPRTKLALELFDEGRLEEAKAILDMAEFERDLERTKQKADTIKKEMTALVGELSTRINVLKAIGLNKESREEVLSLYEKAYEIVTEYNLGWECAVDYVSFLFHLRRTEAGFSIGERLYNRMSALEVKPVLPLIVLSRRLGQVYTSDRRYEEAERCFKECLSLCLQAERDGAPNADCELAGVYRGIAQLQSRKRQWIQAEENYEKALFHAERSGDVVSLMETGKSAMNFYLTEAISRFDKADALCRKMTETRESLGSTTDYARKCGAQLCFLQAKLYAKQGKLEDAEQAFVQAMRQFSYLVEQRGDESSEVELGRVKGELATFYTWTCQKKYDPNYVEQLLTEVLTVRRRWFKIRPRAYGIDLCSGLHTFAGFYKKEQRFAEAEACYKEELQIRAEIAKIDPLVGQRSAWTLIDLAGLYRLQARYTEAEELCKEAVAIRRRAMKDLPEGECLLSRALIQLASVCRQTGRNEAAIPLYCEAIDLLRSVADRLLGNTNLELSAALASLADIYVIEKRDEDARVLYDEAVDRCCAVFGNGSTHHAKVTLNLMKNLSDCYCRMERRQEAVEMYRSKRAMLQGLSDESLRDAVTFAVEEIDRRIEALSVQ
jgi:tetratricopeptide (TPR) repeat protein